MLEAQKLTADALKASEEKMEVYVTSDLVKIEEAIREACALGQSQIFFESKMTMHDPRYAEFLKKKLQNIEFEVIVNGCRLIISWPSKPVIHVRKNPVPGWNT